MNVFGNTEAATYTIKSGLHVGNPKMFYNSMQRKRTHRKNM